MKASYFKVVGGHMSPSIRLTFRRFAVSPPESFDLDFTPDGYRLVKVLGLKPCAWPKTFAAIAAAVRDGAIPVIRAG
ncbi:MAG: hypothetical protein J0I99_00520 [Devosia sp.]|uniref:hypothetical protein n=1 Tax=Devosia sp. TaxID=1871048 RepID=UPI001ACF9E27|nr:hypothetical protein [Devosia sp.]MBN9310847.1 hypothetical protein [Devosia sp.]MBN9314200.1 hypothetical protein [Devosia sp.]